MEENHLEIEFDENESLDEFESSEEILENHLIQDIDSKLSSIITVLKCAVHTLQLAVIDTMKKLNLGPNLNHVRVVIKKLRTPKFRQFHVDNNANKVQLDVPTRWNSIYKLTVNTTTTLYWTTLTPNPILNSLHFTLHFSCSLCSAVKRHSRIL